MFMAVINLVSRWRRAECSEITFPGPGEVRAGEALPQHARGGRRQGGGGSGATLVAL